MRTYDAIQKVSKSIIEDNICDAIIVKGSIGRGEDDEYSDVDMYAVVSEEKMDEFLNNRLKYLSAYKSIIYRGYENFVGPQVVVIYEDGLHFDLYTVTKESLPKTDKIKIVYDPKEIMKEYIPEINYMDKSQCIMLFDEILYNFVEADGAYKRKNYPWATRILENSIAQSAILLRYLYDKEHGYLGLKNINRIIPNEQYLWIEEASENLNIKGYEIANKRIIAILEYFIENVEEDIKEKLNIDFLKWTKRSLKTILF